jgi:hypothetical protein
LLLEVIMMRTRRAFFLLAAGIFVCAFLTYGQDSPSLGDVARQARLQKQQKDAPAKDAAKDSQGKDAQTKEAPGTEATVKNAQPAKAPQVITNDEMPAHVGSTLTSGRGSQTPYTTPEQPNDGAQKAPAEQWKSQIQAQKNAIASLQSQLNVLNESIHYAGGNCVSGCVQWNERQKQKQEQAESMKAQLEEQQKHLEEMQDAARKQGFGSSVYDP